MPSSAHRPTSDHRRLALVQKTQRQHDASAGFHLPFPQVPEVSTWVEKKGCVYYIIEYIYKYIYMVLYIIWFISKLCPNYIIIYNKWCLSESKNRSVMIYLWWDRNHPCWRGPKGPELQPWMVINPQDVHGIYHILMGSIYSGRIIFIYPLRNP